MPAFQGTLTPFCPDFTFQPKDVLPSDRPLEKNEAVLCFDFPYYGFHEAYMRVPAYNNRYTDALLPSNFHSTNTVAFQNGIPTRLGAICKLTSAESAGSRQPPA